jgi:hypothetical protein
MVLQCWDGFRTMLALGSVDHEAFIASLELGSLFSEIQLSLLQCSVPLAFSHAICSSTHSL